jgi:response regulator RpfG family c-di-GMP phosphodiesterase
VPHRGLLIVDDEENVLRSLQRLLREESYSVYCAGCGSEGVEMLRKHPVGVVVSDYRMPYMDGIRFLEWTKTHRPEAVRILLTGYGSLENAMTAVNRSRIFGYLTKPWVDEIMKETIARAFEHHDLIIENKRLLKLTERKNRALRSSNGNLEKMVRRRTRQLEETIQEGILMLALAAEAKDDDTGKHVRRIQQLAHKLCLCLGMSDREAEEIGFFSMIHDIGKIHIPDRILQKPGPLTESEWAVMKTHTTAGEKILGRKSFYKIAREIARSHHERWDGSGYPDGLSGDSIPFAARIVTISDIYDALTSRRPYKRAWPKEKALEEMKALAGNALDPEIAEIFVRNVLH